MSVSCITLMCIYYSFIIKHFFNKNKLQVIIVYITGKPVSKKSRFVAKPRNTISIFNIPEAKHWCPYCDEYFPALKFGIHLRNHSLTDEFHCRKCDRVFAKLKDYSLHKTV